MKIGRSLNVDTVERHAARRLTRPPQPPSRPSGRQGPSPRLSARLLRLACRRSSSAARSLEIGDVLKVMAELNDDGGGVKRCTSLTRRPCLPSARNVSSDSS